MNVKIIMAATAYLFGVAQTSKSAVPRVSKPAVRSFAKPTWKSAIRQVWKPAPQTLTSVDSTLTESKLVKAGQTKSKLVKPKCKNILRIYARGFFGPALRPSGINSTWRVFNPALIRFQFDLYPGLIRPSPTKSDLIRPNPT